MEGPRPVTREELPALERLVDTVFWNGKSGEMFRCFPVFFGESEIENHLVCVEDGGIASHVGMIYRQASIEGCTVLAALVGAVATYEHCRGRGLASKLFKAACEKARADGVDFMLISGGRGLYLRAGATDVGRHYIIDVPRAAAEGLRDSHVVLVEAAPDHIPEWDIANRRRAAHFVRPREDWDALFASKRAMCRVVRLFSIMEGDRFAGYCVLAPDEDDGRASVVEFAARSRDMAAVLAPLLEHAGADRLALRLQYDDLDLRQILVSRGLAPQPVAALGTLLPIDCPQLVDRLRPAISARIGPASGIALECSEDTGRFTFVLGSRRLEADRVGAAHVVFGRPEHTKLPTPFNTAFPFPALWYGVNYV